MKPKEGVRIELKRVTKAYGDKRVLDELNLVVEAGETLVVIGKSGQGKSVLLRLSVGLERPDSGEVLLNGIPADTYRIIPAQKKPFRMAMVFQGSALLNSLSVFENVALYLKEHGMAKGEDLDRLVMNALTSVELEHARDLYPTELSGGMRKRAAIARALATRPDVLLFDEPTAELDPLLSAELAVVIQKIQSAHKMTIIVVTPNLVFARQVADMVALLEDGRIACNVKVGELLNAEYPPLRAFIEAAALA
jgi:phospholipid/cholesterol/gamma-HCH transport system ATP-binding protein